MSQLEQFASSETPSDTTNLKRILKRTSEFYQLAEMYGEYESTIKSLGK
jgi:hypothetical protein